MPKGIYPRKFKNLVGQRFGSWLVKSHAGSSADRQTLFNCECLCGETGIVSSTHLTKGYANSCGCRTHLIKDITGERFGRLLVVIQTKKIKGTPPTCLCLCDCGNVKLIEQSMLLCGHNTTCGCHFKKYSKEESNWYRQYRSYSSDASERNLIFELSFEDFKKICQQDCFYCQDPPEKRYENEKKAADPIITNGIDRVDNDKGYTLENCVPCCSFCNYAKAAMSVDDFENQVLAIAKCMRQKGYGN